MSNKKTKFLIAGGFVIGVTALAGSLFLVTRMSTDGPANESAADAVTARTKKKRRVYKPRYKWRSVRNRHWQIISSKFEEPEKTDAREGNRGSCSPGMVQVKGRMLQEKVTNPYAAERIETAQLTTCTDWIQRKYPERCAKFDRKKWLKISEEYERKPMKFCIDRYEYPNKRGQYPLIFVSWYEARDMCKEQGKRLCNEDEWTFACEGEEGRPYPYGDGYTRSAKTCITDQQWTPYNEKSMIPRDGDAAGNEMDRLWKGKRSGRQKRCRSVFGVYDMTGNIDEWTRTTRSHGLKSILKGGYWGPVRTRCRPSTRSHDENHTFYQQGFRCCTDHGKKLKQGSARDNSAAAPLPRELR